MNIARDKCAPPITPKFSVIRKPEGDIYVIKVLRFRFLPHAVLTKEGKIYFIRVGTTVREAEPSELALLFESAKEEVLKKPKLELLLIDEEGNATNKILAQPTFIKTKRVPKPETVSPIFASVAELNKQIQSITDLFGRKERSKDLVPIGIEVSNAGEIPAQGIRVFLKFPQ